ncbi:MAG: hypothetical protein EXR31_08225 [Betaproteobacteria bacterium]|nr:hypothetical protein [Betaproteobacteria bacterium]
MKRIPVLLLAVATSSSVHAHPGHSALAATIDEWVHLLLSPDHLFGTLVAAGLAFGLLAALATRMVRRSRRDDSR